MLITFGGQTTDGWELQDSFIPEGWMGVVTRGVCPGGIPPSKYRLVDRDAYLPDIVNAVDAVIGKIGYGVSSHAVSAASFISHSSSLSYLNPDRLRGAGT